MDNSYAFIVWLQNHCVQRVWKTEKKVI